MQTVIVNLENSQHAFWADEIEIKFVNIIVEICPSNGNNWYFSTKGLQNIISWKGDDETNASDIKCYFPDGKMQEFDSLGELMVALSWLDKKEK